MSELAKYQQIFERDPTDLHAFNNVCTAAEKVKDYEYLTELLKYRTQITGDEQEIVDLLFRAGVVYLEKMNDIARGVEVLLQAFDLDQTHAGIGARLEKAYVDAGDWEAALAIIEGRLQALTKADVEGTKVSIRSDLHQQAGELLEDRVKDNDRALSHYRKAIELDKTNVSALFRAREMYMKLGKFKNAAKLCELEARLEKDADRKVSLYRELAKILGDKLKDKTQAVTALKRALKADQHNDDVKFELAKTIADAPMDPAHAKDHKWASDYLTKQAKHTAGIDGLNYACVAIRAFPTNEKAIAVAGAKAKETKEFKPLIAECKKAYATLSDINEQAPLIRRIVKSYLQLGAMVDALAWAEKIESVATEKDMLLIQKLKEASSAGSMPSLDSEIPESAMELPDRASEAPAPAEIKNSVAAAEPASAVEPVHAAIPTEPPEGVSFEDWLTQLHRDAEKARRTGDDVHAEEMMRVIVENRPGDQKATTYLERRYRGKEDWRSLRDLLVKCVETDDFPAAVKTVRLRQAAKLAEENLNDLDGAIDTWYKIKEHDPKVRDAKDALERLLADTGRWEELVALFTEEAETTKSRSKKVAAYQRLAEIYKVRLNDATMAAEAYKNVIELAPDDKDAVEALDELYLREQQYDKLVPLLDKRAADARDKAEKKSLILRAATLLQERLGHSEEAFQHAQTILEILPGDLDAIAVMEGVDEESENWERLVETLNLKGRVMKEPEGKIAAYKKVATIASVRLADTGLALKAWNKVLDVDGADVEALDATTSLYEEAGEWTELVRILRLRIESADADVDKIDYYKKLATVLEHELVSPEEAIVEWQNLLKIEEDEDALGALARWYESKGNYKQLVDVLARQAPMVEDHEVKSDVLFMRASIYYEQLGQKEKAVEELKKINTEVNPAHVPTLGLLRDVLVEEGNYEEAVEILEQQIGYCEEKDELKTFYVLLGDWCRNELSDLPRAQDAYEKAASMDITDDELLDTLDAVFVQSEEWDKLLKMMYGRYQRSDDDDEKFRFLTRGGQLCEEKLSDSKQAWGWYRQLFDNMRHYDGAIEAVEEAAHRMSLWNELIDVYGVLTKEGTDSDKVTWWLKIGRIFEEKIEDPGQALEAVLRAFGLEPDNEEMLDSVDRLAVAGLAWDRLATVYAVLAKRAPDTSAKIDKHLRHAKVLFEEGEQASMAFDVVLKAFELDPSSEEMLSKVEQIGAAAERFEELVKVYNVCSDREESISRKVDLLLRAAATCKENLDDGDGALERTLDALAVSPFDEEVVEKVWAMVRELEADLLETEKGVYWNKMVDIYRQLADAHRRETDKQVELMLVISKIYADELQEKSLAFDALKDAQGLAPNDENTIDKLEEMAGELDMWEDLVEHYRDILDETFEMNTAVMYHRRRARILSEQLDQSEEAAEHYWQIIQLDAQDERAYAALLNYYQNAEKWNDLVNLLERQLDAASDDAKRQELLLQIADIWEHKIGNKYEAKDWYEQVVTIWPDNEKAVAALERLGSTNKIEMGDDEDDEFDEDMEQLVSIAPPPAMPEDQLDDSEEETGEFDSDSDSEPSLEESDDSEDVDEGESLVTGDVADDFDEDAAEETAANDLDEDIAEESDAADDDDEEADESFDTDETDLEHDTDAVEAESEEDGDVDDILDEETEDESDDVSEDELDTDSLTSDDDAEDEVPEMDDVSEEEATGDEALAADEDVDAVDAEEKATLADEDSDGDSDLFFGEEEEEEIAEIEAEEDDGVPKPPIPPKPPMPPRISTAPGGPSVAPPAPPPAPSGIPGPLSIPSPPSVSGIPKPPSIPSPPSVGSLAPPPPPPIKK